MWGVGWVALGLLLLELVRRVVEWAWWRPRKLERALRAQGLRGTPYRPLYGDINDDVRLNREAQATPIPLSHDIGPRVAAFLHRTTREHGKVSFTWFGPYPRVTVIDPELIREILSNKFGHYGKPNMNPVAKLFATGLATYEGEKWARHRRIMNPAFHLEKLKLMLPAISISCDELIKRWEMIIGTEGSHEIDVGPEFHSFTGDVISRTAFGSSHDEGQRIFQLQNEHAELLFEAAQTIYIPGYRFLATKKNIRRKEINREVQLILRSIIEERGRAIRNGDSSNNDLLGLLMDSNLKDFQDKEKFVDNRMTTEDVIEECKLFYFAGYETTSVLLTWTLIVLSMHPSWQTRAREEVLHIFGKNKPDFDGLNRLKIVTMILHEVLRLYPPGIPLTRKTDKQTKLGGITLPPGVQLVLPIIFVHHDPEFWGEDANEFKPERFSEGVSKASKSQVAFFPFGWGPRICIGQSLAMLEAKMALSTILQRFSFELSPSYAHAPHAVLTLRPQHGAQIILCRL